MAEPRWSNGEMLEPPPNLPAGSSVPEAARAAMGLGDALTEHQDRESRWAAALDTTPGDADVQAAMTLADAEVAAAVAEERATTGRRIEAIERLCKGIERDSTASVYGAEAKGYAKVVAVQLRAALASPGEET